MVVLLLLLLLVSLLFVFTTSLHSYVFSLLVLFTLCLPVIGYLVAVKHGKKLTELN